MENLRLAGCTLEEYDRLLEEQSGHCAVCDAYIGEGMCVDHDHATGEVRGLLCTGCNLGLGNFQDDVAVLANAIIYLSRSRSE